MHRGQILKRMRLAENPEPSCTPKMLFYMAHATKKNFQLKYVVILQNGDFKVWLTESSCFQRIDPVYSSVCIF